LVGCGRAVLWIRTASFPLLLPDLLRWGIIACTAIVVNVMADTSSGSDRMATYLTRLWRFLGSTAVAVLLLVAVLLGALVGTLFPQLTPDTAADPAAVARWLTAAQEKYGFLFGLYRALGLFDVYHSPWFLALITALILNTVVCTVDRLRVLWRAVTARPRIEQADVFYERMPHRISLAIASREQGEKALRRVLGRRHYHVVAERQDGVTYLFAERNRLARLATLVTHASLVLLVLGFLWSGWGGWRERAVALGPGQVYDVGHGQSFAVRSDGLEIERYPNGQPSDYRAHLAVLEKGTEVMHKTVRVNDPLTYHGVSFYLYSYGPAGRVRATDAQGKPVPLKVEAGQGGTSGEVTLNFAGEGDGQEIVVPSLDFTMRLVFYYQGPSLFVQATRSGEAKPFGAGSIRGGDSLKVGDVTFDFTLDRYIVLQVVHDPGFRLVILAGFLVMGGLVFSFYFPHKRLWARVTANELWLAGRTEQDAVGFEKEFAGLVKGLKRGLS
jgi:cytochrome c biogenesis protein